MNVYGRITSCLIFENLDGGGERLYEGTLIFSILGWGRGFLKFNSMYPSQEKSTCSSLRIIHLSIMHQASDVFMTLKFILKAKCNIIQLKLVAKIS